MLSTCGAGWHVRRDFLRLWDPQGRRVMFFRYLSRLRDEHGTLMYRVGLEPVDDAARTVWCYEDRGEPWRCEACGAAVTGRALVM
jgi:hypothetical protein